MLYENTRCSEKYPNFTILIWRKIMNDIIFYVVIIQLKLNI